MNKVIFFILTAFAASAFSQDSTALANIADSAPTDAQKVSPYTLVIVALIALTVYLVRKSAKGTDKASKRNMKLYVLSAWLSLPSFAFLSFIGFGLGNSGMGVIFLACLAVSAYFLYKRFRKGKELQKKTAENEKIIKEQINRIYEGELPKATTRKAIMREGEEAHFAESASLVENKTTGYTSGGASVRFRVAKGVSIGSGGGRSRAIKENLVTSNGELVITNKRIVFAGDRKSFETPLSKLTSFETYSDGIAFHIDTKSHTLLLDGSEAKLADAILNNILH